MRYGLRKMKRTTFTIGEQFPWRLTKESGYKLGAALIYSNGSILYSGIDRTCPPIHVVMKISVPSEKLRIFRETLGHKLERAEEITGQ